MPDREETRLATLGLTMIGFGFSAYLTYRELFSIHAICEWCLSSAVILTILLGCAIARYLLGSPATPAPVADGGAPATRARSAATLASSARLTAAAVAVRPRSADDAGVSWRSTRAAGAPGAG